MTGAPWYHMLAFNEYIIPFCYVGPENDEREKLIEDGIEDEFIPQEEGDESNPQMTESCKLAREEQSDMVSVLLNLAYIPDWVIQHEDFHFKPGWSLTFKALMDEYK